jgi:hypothetical protein
MTPHPGMAPVGLRCGRWKSGLRERLASARLIRRIAESRANRCSPHPTQGPASMMLISRYTMLYLAAISVVGDDTYNLLHLSLAHIE